MAISEDTPRQVVDPDELCSLDAVPSAVRSISGRRWIRFSIAFALDTTAGAIGRLWKALSSL